MSRCNVHYGSVLCAGGQVELSAAVFDHTRLNVTASHMNVKILGASNPDDMYYNSPRHFVRLSLRTSCVISIVGCSSSSPSSVRNVRVVCGPYRVSYQVAGMQGCSAPERERERVSTGEAVMALWPWLLLIYCCYGGYCDGRSASWPPPRSQPLCSVVTSVESATGADADVNTPLVHTPPSSLC
jgi:hypothetical protein